MCNMEYTDPEGSRASYAPVTVIQTQGKLKHNRSSNCRKKGKECLWEKMSITYWFLTLSESLVVLRVWCKLWGLLQENCKHTWKENNFQFLLYIWMYVHLDMCVQTHIHLVCVYRYVCAHTSVLWAHTHTQMLVGKGNVDTSE